jgi:N-acetyl-gamma-glutamyl-phosphate reductase
MAVVAAAGGARAGSPVGDVHPHLAGVSGIVLAGADEVAAAGADVVFSCLPSGALSAHLDRLASAIVVDLSDDHRSDDGWGYGLTEFNRSGIAGSRSIANPGCYPTATLLALVPFVRAGVVEGPVGVDAFSGVSGAGRQAEDRLLLSTLDGSAGAYGTVSHRHVPEMERYLTVFAGRSVVVSFTPHLAPMSRGLVTTVRARLTSDLDDEAAIEVLRASYDGEPFVHVVPNWPQTKAVAGSNRVLVSARVDRRAGFLVASAAIDNLGKGAAGQAIQNANLALGLEETAGLEHVGVWP